MGGTFSWSSSGSDKLGVGEEIQAKIDHKVRRPSTDLSCTLGRSNVDHSLQLMVVVEKEY